MSDQLNEGMPQVEFERVDPPADRVGFRETVAVIAALGIATAAIVAGNVLMAAGDDKRQEIDEDQANGSIDADEANRRLAALEKN